jgi:hypothetical protein
VKFYYDNDDRNVEQAWMRKISGGVCNYKIREDWGRIDIGIY